VQRLLRDGAPEDEAATAEAKRAAEPPEPGRPQLPLPGLPTAPEPARAAGTKPVVRVRAEGAPATGAPAPDPRTAERLAALKAALAEAVQELVSIRDMLVRAARRRG
jgi:hypothetical protein